MKLTPIPLLVCLVVSAMNNASADALRRVDLRKVEVGGEIGRRIDITINNNLMVLDADGVFLKPFREKQGHGGYIGLGKLIDAAVRFAAYSEDPEVLARKEYLVREIIATQEEDGYIGYFVPQARLWKLWDIHEMGYLIYGLAMDHRFFGNEDALLAAQKAADYILDGWGADPGRKPGDGDITVYMAVTGLETALLALYDETQNQKYLDGVTGLRKLQEWDGPIVTGRWGPIQGHVYAYICRSFAQVRLNKIQPDPRLLIPTQRALDFMLKGDGLSIIGTCGQHECWHDTQDGVANLGETCATAYIIRWLDALLRKESNALYADMMERAIYNALFAAQSPDGRQIRYYVPFEGKRVYWKGDAYCCPCNYRRIVAELPQMIYYTADKGVAVNLYTESSAELTLPCGTDLQLVQETNYPSDGEVTLHVNVAKAAQFPLRLRIPAWCTKGSIAINKKVWGGDWKPGTFVAIDRTWKPGDEVQIAFEMPLRLVKGFKAQAGRVAVMRGPQVFALNRKAHEKLADADLRAITIDPSSLEGPGEDQSVRPGGQSCTVQAWRTTSWYPAAQHDFSLTLTEYADPDAEATYFHVPNPNDETFADDELIARP